jgi:hypothetical protein
MDFKQLPAATTQALLGALFPAVVRGAHEAERTSHHGYCLGLTEAEVKETVAEWSQEYMKRSDSLPWDRVRRALTTRAMNKAGIPIRPLRPGDVSYLLIRQTPADGRS